MLGLLRMNASDRFVRKREEKKRERERQKKGKKRRNARDIY